MSNNANKIGFIGLGIMGAPMALNLMRAGNKLFTHTRGKTPDILAEGGATLCTTNKGVAERSDIIFLMVPDTPQVQEVLFGENGVVHGLTPGKIVVDMSSISPIATKEFAAKIRAKGLSIWMRRFPVVKSEPRTPRCPSWSAASRKLLTRSSHFLS
jgi:2-hydroxy-3-oxopropionate reductase